MNYINDRKGISLVVLVVTIIVLLILVGVTTQLLSNRNIINAAETSAKNSIVSGEKEQIMVAWNTLLIDVADKTIDIIDDDKFEDKLNNGSNIASVDYIDNAFLVKFLATNNEYIVDYNGNITLNENTSSESALTINNYVKDGLIVWYDGIKNTRNGNNPNATAWEDLSGNNNDGIYSSAIVANQSDINQSSKGYYNDTEKGYTFWHNDAYIQSQNNLGIVGDDLFSVELIVNIYSSGTNPNIAANRHDRCANMLWFGKDAWDTGAQFTILSRDDGLLGIDTINKYYGVSSGAIQWDNKTAITVVKHTTGSSTGDENGKFRMYVNGENIATPVKGHAVTYHIQDEPVIVGRGWQFWSADRTIYGTIYSVRIYDRVLTDEEVMNNYLIDNARYEIE